jgi:hypothetical protein
MAAVVFVLPSLLMLFDHLILKTSRGFVDPDRALLNADAALD